ncbi:dihydroorotase [candidate division WOR-3 bacterium]|nr:dihydroorotase [candidate division WOR-3 bacterium]
MRITIKGAHLYDPKNNIDEIGDLYIKDGIVTESSNTSSDIEIDARGLYLIPGLVDIHSHFREPGKEDAETVETGSKAAVKGGFTSVAVMPNTNPPIDNEGVVRYIKEKASNLGICRIFPIGTITKGRKGQELSEMGHLYEAGCVGFSDDGNCVENSSVFRRALEYSLLFDVPIIDHPEDSDLSRDGQINEGIISTKLGFKGIPDVSEASIIARDILLAKFTGGRLHLAHISAESSIGFLKHGKEDGINVTAEVTPHHLLLTEESVVNFDTNTKMKPPLRSSTDREALIRALREGIINAIATDHAPHPVYEKEVEYSLAPFGVVGLETAFSALYTNLVLKNKLSFEELINSMSNKPAKILNLPLGEIRKGGTADFTLVDTEKEWVVDPDNFASKSINSPFIGWRLKGLVKLTIVNGIITFRENEFFKGGKN